MNRYPLLRRIRPDLVPNRPEPIREQRPGPRPDDGVPEWVRLMREGKLRAKALDS